MAVSDIIKIAIVGAVILLLVVGLYKSSRSMTQNEGEVKVEVTEEVETSQPKTASSTPLNKDMAKFITKNTARDGYKNFDYLEGTRGGNAMDVWDQYFDKSNRLVDTPLDNDKFHPRMDYPMLDSPHGSYETHAPYNPNGPKRKESPEEIFNSTNYLPQEVNDDWFEVMPEPIAVKDRHLINVTKPIGVNTIGSSLRNPSYDIRGSPQCPKFTVSPWMQSTIEPDYNLKPLC